MSNEQHDEVLILLQESPVRGSVSVSITNENLQNISIAALNNAMKTLRGVAEEVVSTIKGIKLSERPDQAEVEFGLMLTSDAKAFIVNASAQAQFKVTLTWSRTAEQAEQEEPK